ncbi:alpha-ketoglutarate-dependent taurine dioxygenase [Macrolepiota fuliginosa MF-IS2]|uniref:Alpha-ketoglutarate-dependent taurine dioxygenase n=1 Tax=Macrolepiota fuliginosa MF-IS2 TaxID=1400762 RepID=A0A9P6C700_9AGAR|nr:alpha-ketoglutarate-dependent taurine dioxygenase [Macrolepiota fuliginosa MF-IS2]
MAPSAAQLETPVDLAPFDKVAELKKNIISVGRGVPEGVSYPFYYPYYDLTEKWAPLEVFEHNEPGLRANPAKPNLLTPNTQTRDLSPYLGTELHGVQLSQLSKEGLDELALLTAERKVLIFRDQDFKDLDPDRQLEIARHFGPIHRHPTSGNVKGYPEYHVVYRDNAEDRNKGYREIDLKTNLISWHSDVSYEKQPPGTTWFWILDQPQTGGDTLFLSQVEAYNRLSPEFRKRLEGLTAVHSAVDQAEYSKRIGGPVRREAVESEHPLVRVHPVTGEKALYLNEGFTRRIIGFKKEESDNLLKFLFDHLAKSADFQIRASYEPGTVVIWDNRVTCHSATRDFNPEFRRHAVRLTPQAEVPVPAKSD